MNRDVPPSGALCSRRTGKSQRPLLCCVLLAVACRGVRAADDITWFRIKDVDGELLSRQLYDQSDSAGTNGASASQRQLTRRNQIDLRVSSYVYHPNFAVLDLNGGPVFEQSSFRSDNFDDSQDLVDVNVSARATFLRNKPYRGALFYTESHPTLLVGFGETATSDNSHYGAEFDLLAPVTPVPFHLDVSRRDNDVVGSTRESTNRIDRLHGRASKNLATYGSSTLNFHIVNQDSSNANPGLARQTSSLDSRAVNLHTRVTLGDRDQHDFTNQINFIHEAQDLSFGSIPNRDDLRISLDYRGNHSDRLRTFAVFNHDNSWRQDLDQRTERAAAGVNYEPLEDLLLNFGTRGEQARSERLDNDLLGFDAGARYRRRLPLGQGSANYALRFDIRSQEQRGTAFDVFGESIVLTGLSDVTLSQTRIVAGSVSVSDSNRTRVFFEGIDYELVVTGIETRIRRLATGAILDGEQLLVDYSVEVGGTFNSLEHYHSYSAQWQVWSFLELQYRGNLSRIDVTSGTPSFELNETRGDTFAMRADYPLPWRTWDIALGTNLEYEDRDATVESFKRTNVELFARSRLPWLPRAGVRVGLRRSEINHEFDAGDSDLRAFDINVFSRHRFGINLSLDASYEEDVGGLLPRERLSTGLHASGRYRRLEIRGEVVHTRESQGAFDRNRTHALLEIRRAFF